MNYLFMFFMAVFLTICIEYIPTRALSVKTEDIILVNTITNLSLNLTLMILFTFHFPGWCYTVITWGLELAVAYTETLLYARRLRVKKEKIWGKVFFINLLSYTFGLLM